MMELLLPALIAVGMLVLTLLIVLVPMRWLANKFGAGRTGYLHCFLALIVPYVVTVILGIGVGILAAMVGLEGPFIAIGLGVLILILSFYLFAKILDTTILRGILIAITTNIAVTVIVGVLMFGATMLGIGGAGLAGLATMAGGGMMGMPGGMEGAPQTTAPKKSGKPKTKEVRDLRKYVTALCDCVDEGKTCRSEQTKLTRAMEKVDQVQVKAAEEETVFNLQVLGAQCLNDAVALQAKEPAASNAAAPSAPAAQPAAPKAPAVPEPAAAPAATTTAAVSSAVASTANSSAGSSRAKYTYREVSVLSLESHVGKLVRVTMIDGEERADILEGLTATVIRLRQSKARGGRLYELPTDGIDRIQVLDRW